MTAYSAHNHEVQGVTLLAVDAIAMEKLALTENVLAEDLKIR